MKNGRRVCPDRGQAVLGHSSSAVRAAVSASPSVAASARANLTLMLRVSVTLYASVSVRFNWLGRKRVGSVQLDNAKLSRADFLGDSRALE